MAETEFEKEINATLYGIAKELGINQSNATVAMKRAWKYRDSYQKCSIKNF